MFFCDKFVTHRLIAMKKAIVTGAGGFIGSHFVNYLKKKGYIVCGIDVKKPDFSPSQADSFTIGDLREPSTAQKHITSADELYMFAANMGGMGYIDHVRAKIMHDNVLINANTLEAAREANITTIFFASSACVYPLEKQGKSKNKGLKETEAIPADPDTMYGWEKLFSEMLCKSYALDYGMKVHVARFHNVYGPEGAFDGGKEKSIAALCRKIAQAKSGDAIEVWGDGKQTRSCCYINDCCEGVFRLMQSSYLDPVNIGSSELVNINTLIDKIARIAGKKIRKEYDRTKPQGVRGRNSDNTLIRKLLAWEPKIMLENGLRSTYVWIYNQVQKQARY